MNEVARISVYEGLSAMTRNDPVATTSAVFGATTGLTFESTREELGRLEDEGVVASKPAGGERVWWFADATAADVGQGVGTPNDDEEVER